MKIERIKKNHKKEIIIGGLILVSVVSAITLVTTRAKYRVTQDIKLVNGTVNYKPYDFKIMAMYQSEYGTNYTEINTMPTSGYVINEEKSYCTTDNKAQVKGKIKTIDGNHVISNLKKSDKCYVWFDKEKSASEKTLAKLNITVKEGTPDFNQVATTDEGVYAVNDEIYGGASYYFRGAVTNNYVKFANKCWRIIRINGDGTIRLIYGGNNCYANGTNAADSLAITNVAYNASSNNSSYVGWTYTASSQRTLIGTASNAKTRTENWFNNNITGTNANKIVTGKFCNDRNIGSGAYSATGTTFYYAVYNRINSGAPTLNCTSGDIYELKVGAITADEVMYAGGTNTNNFSYYLSNGNTYWTMSPYHWSGNYASEAFVGGNGNLGYYNVSNTDGIRPVINLRSDITFSSGDGTQNNPYVVS